MTATDINSQIVSFPEAEGWGKYSVGGRGGKIIEVTTLEDSGPGSLRKAINQFGARIIIFRVSGNISLASNLTLTNDSITIAGQTAPGDGICIKNFPLEIRANEVIIRYLRFRLGDEFKNQDDALNILFSKNVIIDHCSASWGIDENLSDEAAYQLLEDNEFAYSSSIYAPAGTLVHKGKVWEIPVSTLQWRGKNDIYMAPRAFNFRLLFSGEFPYGSSFSIGLLGTQILKFIERDLKRGLNPSIFLHPYELVKPPSSARLMRDLIRNPHLVPFLRDKSGFLKTLLQNFPVSPLGTYLDEMVAAR